MAALTFAKFVLFIVLGLWLFAAISSYSQTTYDETLVPRASAAAGPVFFDAVGVLTFYEQTDGLQPWLLYETPSSTVAAKSLSLGASALRSAYGSREVRVSGAVVNEHLADVRIALATSTDPRIQFLQAAVDESGSAGGVTLTPRMLGKAGQAALAWVDAEHDGTAEQLFFRQGTLVPVGQRQVSLLYEHGGTLYFAVMIDR